MAHQENKFDSMIKLITELDFKLVDKKTSFDTLLEMIDAAPPPPKPAYTITFPAQAQAAPAVAPHHVDVGSAVDLINTFEDKAKQEEGLKTKIYYVDHKPHIGYGHLLVGNEIVKYKHGISVEDAEALLQHDIVKKLSLVHKQFGSVFNDYSKELQLTILDGFYRGDLAESPHTIQLLKDKNFKAAAKEYLNNKEYKTTSLSGVKNRMLHNAKVMANEVNQ